MSLKEKFEKASTANLVELIPMLQESPELSTAADKNGCTLLFEACANQDLDRVVALLSEGANPNQGNNFGVQPIEAFIYAATSGVQTADNYNDIMLHALVESGAYPTDDAIMRATETGHDEWADYMSEKLFSMPKP